MGISIIKNRVKEFIKLVYTCPNYRTILNEIKNHNESLIVLFGTPAHGNLGDHAIAISELHYLHNISGQRRVIEIPMPLYKSFRKQIRRFIRNDDTIIISGGGWFGNLWIHNEITIREIVSDYKCNRIIVFPQTLYYTDDEHGMATAKDTKKVLNKHNDLILTVRDWESYKYAEKVLGFVPGHNLLFCPDMVLYGTLALKSVNMPTEKKALLCFRDDIEKKYDTSSIRNVLEDAGFAITETSTVLRKLIPMNKRDKTVESKIKEFNDASIVITDRLHAMLFALLTGTPCFAFDNTTGKVFGVGQYLYETGMPVYLIDSICKSMIDNTDLNKRAYCLNGGLKTYFQNLALYVNNKENYYK